MKELTVSIVIPVYNSKGTIIKCVNSIIEQNYSNLEILLIDDGSTDGSERICDQLAAKDNRIKVYHQINLGASAARNKGIEAATGEYLMFVDSDDYLEKNAVELCVAYQREFYADLIIFGYFVGDNAIIDGQNIINLNTVETAKQVAGIRGSSIKGYLWNKFFSISIINDNKLRFDTEISLCEDALFCQEYITFCKKIIYLPFALYHYSINSTSFTHAKISKRTCSVFNAYEKILTCCDLFYKDKELNNLLLSNYYSHYILNLQRIKNELTVEERKEFWYIYEFIKKNIFKILKNKYIKLKRKLLAIYLILTVKNN